ncbi:sigma-70 family RNA polymerase sigma factor [Micromonospora sp. B9E7]|uniref:RNA polymerase sigma factor n=1 Tax=Micromonospora sp. B9E7 TaxID=3153574 RepID=UPI00325D462A
MRQLSDEELLVAVAAGPGALDEFYRRHVAKITGMGVRRFNRAEDVADFVASVFLEVLKSASGFDARRGNAVSWLFGVAGNVAAAMHRDRFRQADVEQRVSGRALLDADDYQRVEQRIDAAAEVRRVYAAIRQLSDADRRVLELSGVDGLKAADIAAALGINQIAVRVRLARARQRLRAQLATNTGSHSATPVRAREKALNTSGGN